MKPLDPNDPRFTAKALGEEEIQPIDSDAEEAFESLKGFTRELKRELHRHACAESLTDAQKAAVEQAFAERASQPKNRKILVFPFWRSAIAACLLVGLTGIVTWTVFKASLQQTVTWETSAISIEPPPPPPPTVGDESAITLFRPGQQRQVSQVPGEVFELSPIAVESLEEDGFEASSALAGQRLGKEFWGPVGYGGTGADVVLPPVPPTIAIPQDFRGIPADNAFAREAYDRITENEFKNPVDHPLSTFSIDVDTASYANVRRFLNGGRLPPPDAVRIEELINYFPYDYAGPDDETPFAVHVDAAAAPWKPEHRLVRIGLQGETVATSDRPDANLVFLIDVSGSMSSPDKLELVQQSLNLLVEQMEARDRIAVVVYAGASGLALPSTTANNQETIKHAINNLRSGGSTNGGAGIELAYSVARQHFIPDGINRVILCTDGDFNVGTTDRGSLTRLIEDKAKTGVFFSVLGFGVGNYQDAAMEELSNKGNGNYGYVDSIAEARKVFVDQMLGTLMTIAKDVKIQVEFNPGLVGAYRLIGYENRMLAKEDFNDDTKDAGEIGAGHSVTALYEIMPAGLAAETTPSVDPLKYQSPVVREPAVKSGELLTVKLRYKQPDSDESQLIEQPFVDPGAAFDAASDDFRFATAVAAFGMLLRNSQYTESMTLDEALDLARQAKAKDSGGLRSAFIELIEKARQLTPKPEAPRRNGTKGEED
ncbi:MAG: DUF3520 domain-containing protein [Opitutae bacterium]|nr:DUF3520 domain-containing protein [Opitutae bacterium]